VVTPASVVNLTVHGIGPAPRPLDPDEDGTWVGTDQFERVLDAVAGRGDVVITFDDGNASDVEIALPRLVERNLTAEFFLPAGLLCQPGRLDHEGVRELLRAGMSIGSHGWAHINWRGLDDRQAKREMVEAHQVLDELTGHRVSRVAVPFGAYDRHVLRRLRQARVTRVAAAAQQPPPRPRRRLDQPGAQRRAAVAGTGEEAGRACHQADPGVRQ